MNAKCRLLLLFLLAVTSCAPAAPDPDEGLSGTWSGGWGAEGDTRRDQVSVRLDWDGTRLRGAVNPGGNEMAIEEGTFDPASGAITFAFDASDDGRAVRYSITGKVEAGVMAGQWTRPDRNGDFRLTKE
jgi:hypothetical protein